jgi:hypothetical protein
MKQEKKNFKPRRENGKPSLTEKDVQEFKDLDAKRKSGKLTESEFGRAKDLAGKMKRFRGAGTNDISWYSSYPALLKDTSNVVFNEIAGTMFPVTVAGANNNLNWPTVGARILVMPSIGKCSTANDAFNYQMRNLWLALHRAYRGIGTYEYADLGIVMYAIICGFADIARAERIYGSLMHFQSRNRSYPNALIEALGVDPAGISSAQLADFRYQINRVIAKAKVLCLPKGLPVFDQYITLFGNIFKDAENVRAQWVVYDNPFLIKYDPTFTTGGSVTYEARTTSGTNGQTLADLITDLNVLFDNLLSDTDVARMCSDLLKAFGDDGVQGLEYIPEDFIVLPIRDEVRLLQLHNTVFTGSLYGTNFSSAILTALGSFSKNEETLRIYQEGGVVHQEIASRFGGSLLGESCSAASTYKTSGGVEKCTSTTDLTPHSLSDVIVDCWIEDPSGDDIIEMTRQLVHFNFGTVTSGGTTYYYADIDNFSTYIVMGMQLFCGLESSGSYKQGSLIYTNITRHSSINAYAGAAYRVANLSHIDWHPYIIIQYEAGGNIISSAVFYDMDNYTALSSTALSRMHDACTLSLFHLPALSSVQDK